MEYPERLKLLNLPSLAYRRLRGDMIQVYQHFNTYDACTLSKAFRPRERTSRKHPFQLHSQRPRDGIRGIQSNSFYFRTPDVWNKLPRTVVNADNVNEFKNNLDDFWKNNPIKFDHTLSILSDSQGQ